MEKNSGNAVEMPIVNASRLPVRFVADKKAWIKRLRAERSDD